MATAPFLGASIDKLGRRKLWLGWWCLMVPLMFGLWWTKPDGSGLPIVATMLITTVIGVLFSYSEVMHNSLLVGAAGMGGRTRPRDWRWPWATFSPFWRSASGLGVRPARARDRAGTGCPAAAAGPQPALLHEPGASSRYGRRDVRCRRLAAVFLHPRRRPDADIGDCTAFAGGAAELWRMIRTVARYRNAAVFLASRMFYVDGMTSILIYAGIYATGVMQVAGAGDAVLRHHLLGPGRAGWVGRPAGFVLGPKRAVQIEIGMSLLGIIAFLGMAPHADPVLLEFRPSAHANLWEGPFFRTLAGVDLPCSSAFPTPSSSPPTTLLVAPCSPASLPPIRPAHSSASMRCRARRPVGSGPFLVNQGTRIFKTQQGGFATIIILLGLGFFGLLFVRGGDATGERVGAPRTG